MSRGFFPELATGRERPAPSLIPKCGSCGLHRKCKSPKMPVTGEGRRKVLVVAEAPGGTEDDKGTQLIGKAGQHLRKFLRQCRVDLDRDCWKTNALSCCRKGTPTDKEVLCCRPNVMRAIRDLEPETILLLGAKAVKSVVGELWKEQVEKVGRWVGWRIPDRRTNAWICPTYHPSYLLREDKPALDLWFGRHLKAAFGLEGRPWPDGPPDYAGQVECVHEPSRAAKIVRGMTRRGGPMSFDYETNKLKPDSADARIVCCAVCWRGRRTVAFPWQREAVDAMRELLAGFEQKIAHNAKFEERWTRAAFGHGVTNWYWDTMQATHVEDNRSGITSLKFQAYVRFGLGPYDEAVGPYLRAKGDGGNDRNTIDGVDLGVLLRYCGMDALVEYKLAELQWEGIK